jgi:hypothetical protein
MHLSRLHKVFVASILWMVSEDTVSGPAHNISVLVSVHTSLSKSRVIVGTTPLTHPISNSKVVANGGKYTAPLMHLRKKKSKGANSGECGGRVIGRPLPIHFSGTFWRKKSIASLWKSGRPRSWETTCHQYRLIQNRPEDFLNSRCHFTSSGCSASGGKICKLKWHELQTWSYNIFRCV